MTAATFGYSSEPRRPGRPGRSGRTKRTGAVPRVRWDRLARTALLAVLAAVLYLYLSAGISLLSTWQEARRTGSAVTTMRREYRRLADQRKTLESPQWLETQARRLGMVYPGEHLFIIPGLPDR